MGTSRRPESDLPRVWEQGASGERILGARLDRITGIEVLHDRRIPGTLTDIDHIAIGPGGAYVIAAKLSSTVNPRGALSHRKRRLFIGDQDQTKLVAKMGAQVTAITRALRETPVPVAAALCFVDAHWPARSEPFVLHEVWVGWPDALAELVTRPGLLDAEAREATARMLDARLPRA